MILVDAPYRNNLNEDVYILSIDDLPFTRNDSDDSPQNINHYDRQTERYHSDESEVCRHCKYGWSNCLPCLVE